MRKLIALVVKRSEDGCRNIDDAKVLPNRNLDVASVVEARENKTRFAASEEEDLGDVLVIGENHTVAGVGAWLQEWADSKIYNCLLS